MIRLYKVSKEYPDGRTALKDVTLNVDEGEFVLLTGPTGSGKSTLLRVLFGSDIPTSGRGVVNGRNLDRLDRPTLASLRRELGLVFQDPRLIDRLPVVENVSLAAEVAGISRDAALGRARDLLEMFGLSSFAASSPAVLSSGERQRVGLARALINRPVLLLADEPTGNLDPDASVEILELLKEVHAEGTTVVIATHDQDALEMLRLPDLVHVPRPHARSRRATNFIEPVSVRPQSTQPASYYVRRAIDSVLATPVIAGVTITSIAVSVLLAGALLLVGSNAFRLIQSWGATGVDVSIYLSRDVGEERVVELKELLSSDSAVIDVRYHSQDEAWQFLADNLGDSADLLDGLDASVLPPSLEVSLGRTVDDDRLDEMLRTWNEFANVEDVQYNRQWIDRLRNAMGIVRWVAWALGALALIVSAIIVGATFQLAAFSRREEMEVLRLVGAVGMVYWGPVLLAGFLEGVIGSASAVGLLVLIYQATATPIANELPMLEGTMQFLTSGQCLTLIFWGALLGVAGSWLGMQRFASWR